MVCIFVSKYAHSLVFLLYNRGLSSTKHLYSIKTSYSERLPTMQGEDFKRLPSPIDSTQYNLADFFASPRAASLPLSERLEEFTEFLGDIAEKKHNLHHRTSFNGSDPVVQVYDPHTEKVREFLNFGSNDYLNLTKNPDAIEAATQAAIKYGVGAGGSPVLSGQFDVHTELSKALAQYLGCEAAILYTSGFGMNYGALSGLLRENDVAILDKYVHASIVDGCKHTNVRYFRHNDVNMLESILKRCKDKFVNKLVIVDGVYSMDGDLAPLDQITEVAHRYGAIVVTDEAHATGVIGPMGRGTPAHFNITDKVDIITGTFSKSLGGVGGFVAGSQKLINYLSGASRSYMFSTAMSPMVAAAMLANVKTISTDDSIRLKLWDNITRFKEGLLGLGLNIGEAQTAILPVIVGDDTLVKSMALELHRAGIFSNFVAYPAVARDMSRLRFTVTAGQTFEQLDKALAVIGEISKSHGII